MKPIVINLKNRNRIEMALADAQNRARERTITIWNIIGVPTLIKEEYGLSVKALEGCRFEFDPNAQDFPRAYKYRPMSTHFVVEVSKGSFKLTAIERTDCWKLGDNMRAWLTDTAKDAIIAKMTHRTVCFHGSSGYLNAKEIIELGLFDKAVEYMTPELKEAICKEMPYCTKEKFLDEYMVRHAKKYCERFVF